jgi:hypothetical protein
MAPTTCDAMLYAREPQEQRFQASDRTVGSNRSALKVSKRAQIPNASCSAYISNAHACDIPADVAGKQNVVSS